MSELKTILSSFKTKKTLNPKIWVKEDSKVKMRPKVREKLLEIANDFIEADLFLNAKDVKEKIRPIRNLLYRINRDFKKI